MAKPHSCETYKLIELVAQLCDRLNRPVCSNDLKAHFRDNPAAIPLLQQRLGQVMIKAARPYRCRDNPLQKIGLIGNQVYYAVGDGDWATALSQHQLLLRMQEVALWRLPETLQPFLGTKVEDAARNALAGFVKEWGHATLPTLVGQIEEARELAAFSFRFHLPSDLIGRKEARALLLKLVGKYQGKLRSRHFNPNRPLVLLRWPQSQLYQQPAALAYSKAQIEAFALWKGGLEGKERLFLSFYDPHVLKRTGKA